MTACGKKCMGAKACVSTCISSKEQYTTTCTGCGYFGDLGQCTRDHCMIQRQCTGGESPAFANSAPSANASLRLRIAPGSLTCHRRLCCRGSQAGMRTSTDAFAAQATAGATARASASSLGGRSVKLQWPHTDNLVHTPSTSLK
jgi:hypothetical protein